jgi:hypothetical protein
MSKLTTTNKVYWTLVETGIPVEQVNAMFQQRGWAIPTQKRGRTVAKPTAEQILNGQVKLPMSTSTVAILMQTLVNNYGVPIDWLAQYLRPVNKRGTTGTTVEETENADEPEDEEYEDEEEKQSEEVVNIF